VNTISPQWGAPARVHALCSTRDGGVSAPPYETLNLGDHVGDDAAAVRENRGRFATALGARPVFLKQVHGTSSIAVDASTVDGTEADACFTRERGVACTIMVADCLPVLVADAAGTIVGAAHCGWRGLAGGVLEALYSAFTKDGMALAWLGPCIGPRAFEVGPDVRDAFCAVDAHAAAAFVPHGEGKFLADLQALARQRLAALGVHNVTGNDGSDAWCTVTGRSRFFSHRRDGTSGRFAAAVWLA
jgi:YfiH family protein